jgi:glycosyltransferase involved in cell wall biosynthesis
MPPVFEQDQTNAAALRSVAAVGDVTDPTCWSGIPFHFWKAARSAGFADIPWRLNLDKIRPARWRWNIGRLLRGKRAGGFQYSSMFLRSAIKQIPAEYFATEIISFHSHFPCYEQVIAAGGGLNHYLDATFAALSSGRGLDLYLPTDVILDGLEQERSNYGASRRIVTMARWSARSVVNDCGLDPAKVATILPGANIEVEDETILNSDSLEGHPGRDRDFVLGFIGMDWKRKGLSFLVDVRDDLARRGWKTVVLAAGDAPASLARREGVRFVGPIRRQQNGHANLLGFLRTCDMGCLFSSNEALGISTLEFLRAGIPVAGFAHQGLDDTLPPDAGFRFQRNATVAGVGDVFEAYLKDELQQETFRSNARRWSTLVTWDRCVKEMSELWSTGKVCNPVRPWLGLDAQMNVNPVRGGTDTCA